MVVNSDALHRIYSKTGVDYLYIIIDESFCLENGISISGGVIIGDTTHEITVSIGNGALLGYAACAGIAAIPVPGARAVAATAACIIFIIDLFN